MEKFQIAKYGMMQVTAIVYGVLASGAAVKLNRLWLEQGYTMPDSFYRAIFYRDYGFFLLGFVMAWVALVSYLSSPYTSWNIEEQYLSHSGLVFALLLVFLGSCVAVGGTVPPPHSTLLTPLP